MTSRTAPEATETTLIIHPDALTDFEEYLDFLVVAETLIEQLNGLQSQEPEQLLEQRYQRLMGYGQFAVAD